MAVSAGSIVKHFHVVEYISACYISHLVDAFCDSLFLQATKEWDNGIVPTVTPTTHAGLQVMGFAKAQPVVTAVLGSLI